MCVCVCKYVCVHVWCVNVCVCVCVGHRQYRILGSLTRIELMAPAGAHKPNASDYQGISCFAMLYVSALTK